MSNEEREVHLKFTTKNLEKNKFEILLGSIIILATFLVYLPAIRGGFIWNDDTFLTNNPIIHAPNGLYYFWFSTKPPDYFPLVSTSLWLEYRLWGMNATGYHITNVFLHAMSSVLVWLVLARLKIPGAWLAGVIFAVHPVNVESVAWITERKNTLPMVFYLMTILLYLRYEFEKWQSRYLLSLCAFLLALLSKTSVVMLPMIILILSWWQRERITRDDLIRSIPFFLLSLLFGFITVWFQYNRAIGDEIVRNDSFLSRLAISGWAIWFYLFKALIPYKLTFVYPRWEINEYSLPSYLPLFAFLLLMTILWFYRNTWGRSLFVGLAYFTVTLLPVLGFLNIFFMKYSLVADHWQYISIIAVITLIAGVASYIINSYQGVLRQIAAAIAVVIVILFSFLTWQQGHIYKDEETVWRDTIKKNPTAWIAYSNLGKILTDKRDTDEAIAINKEALNLKPDSDITHNNLGFALLLKGDIKQAIRHFNAAIKLNSDHSGFYHNLGIAYFKQGRFDEAIKEYKLALSIKPDFAEAHINLGDVYNAQGRVGEAIKEYLIAIRIKPDNVDVHYNLGNLYRNQGRQDEAINEYLTAIRLKPDDFESHGNLGSVYISQGRLDEALKEFLTVLKLNPDDVIAHYNLALAYNRKGLNDKAIEELEIALKLKPDYAPVKELLESLRR